MSQYIEEKLNNKMDNPLISIIIPVYNVEEYLDRCLESVISQTYENIEIILVDDGSSDNCGNKCEDWAKKDCRIIVFHKLNGGLSDARNFGIERASGEFISFIDSDDWVTNEYIENLYSAIVKDGSDLAMSWYIKLSKNSFDNNSTRKLINYKTLSIEECLKNLLYQNKTDTCAWGKLYSRKLFSILQYPVGKLYEDIPVTYAAILNSEKIARIENRDYFYFQRETSIQNMDFNMGKLDAIEHIKTMTDDIQTKYPFLKKACECRNFSVLNNILFQINDINENEELISKIWNEIKKYRKDVLFDYKARNKARAAAFLSYGGYSFLSKMYKRFNV